MDVIHATEEYAAQLSSELEKQSSFEAKRWGSTWTSIVMLAIWNAGRIQGIRKKRAKYLKTLDPKGSYSEREIDLFAINNMLSKATDEQVHLGYAFMKSLLYPGHSGTGRTGIAGKTGGESDAASD